MKLKLIFSSVYQEFLNGEEPQRNLQPSAEGFQSEAYLEEEVYAFKHFKIVNLSQKQ